MSELTLYTGIYGCPFSQRVEMMLFEKGITFESIPVDLNDRNNRPKWWEGLSPLGKIPLIIHGDRHIAESSAICEYLEEVFPQVPLMPKDPYMRARARLWITVADTYLLAKLREQGRSQKEPAKYQKVRGELADLFRQMEFDGLRKFGNGPYWLGDQFTLVDIWFIPWFERLPGFNLFSGATIPDECTRLREWYAFVKERPSVVKTAHDAEYWRGRYQKIKDRVMAENAAA